MLFHRRLKLLEKGTATRQIAVMRGFFSEGEDFIALAMFSSKKIHDSHQRFSYEFNKLTMIVSITRSAFLDLHQGRNTVISGR
jgi:hypothetical protein